MAQSLREGQRIIVDESDGFVWYADFRSAASPEATPTTPMLGCEWSTHREEATEFSSDAEAYRALEARRLIACKNLQIVSANWSPVTRGTQESRNIGPLAP